MKATFRPLRWVEPSTQANRRRSRYAFKAGWASTLDLLERELHYLGAKDLVIEADFGEADIRLDGMPRANARQPVHPGVRIFFDSKYGSLVYATDSCSFWQHNVRSIALGLEALRAVDRYGVTRRGEQYTGWKAIGTGPTPMPGEAAMSRQEAATLMAKLVDPQSLIPTLKQTLLDDLRFVEVTYRKALRSAHPDSGGSAELFASLQEAKRILQGGAP